MLALALGDMSLGVVFLVGVLIGVLLGGLLLGFVLGTMALRTGR